MSADLSSDLSVDPTATYETHRLLLRRWRPEDVAAMLIPCRDPEIMQYHLDGHLVDEAEMRATIERLEAHWERHGYGLWACVSKETGTVIGWTGLIDTYDILVVTPEELHDLLLPSVEVGYRFNRAFLGRGIELEAILFSLEHGFGRLGFDRILSVFNIANPGWRALADVAGMAKICETLQHNADGSVVPLEIRCMTGEAWAQRGFRAVGGGRVGSATRSASRAG